MRTSKLQEPRFFICPNCKKKIFVDYPYQTKPRKGLKYRYCSPKCQMEYEYKTNKRELTIEKSHEIIRQRGAEKFNKKPTRKIGKRGYLEIYIPVLIAKQKGLPTGWLKYHHYVWWKYKGKLPPVNAQMHIHHKDSNKLNNVIENLELISSSEHMKKHNKKWKEERKGISK